MTRAVIALLAIIVLSGLIENLPNEITNFLGLALMLTIIGSLIYAMIKLACEK